jgi:hypothetical protein
MEIDMLINLNNWLDDVPGLKTEKGAMARLNKVLKLVEQNGSKWMIYRQPNGCFVPLVIASSNDWAVGAYAHNGVCVTN